jgi:hypothetical protein
MSCHGWQENIPNPLKSKLHSRIILNRNSASQPAGDENPERF